MSDPESGAALKEHQVEAESGQAPASNTDAADSKTLAVGQPQTDVLQKAAAAANVGTDDAMTEPSTEAAAAGTAEGHSSPAPGTSATGASAASGSTPARTPASEPLPSGQLGRLAESDESCFVCGHRWQSSLRHRLAREVYMFALPRRPTTRRDWLLSLQWSRASAPPPDGRLCSLHFGPGDVRAVPGQKHMVQLLPIAMPRRRYCDDSESERRHRCSYPLCRGQRRQLLEVLSEIQERGSGPLRRAARPYWSRRQFPLPEPGPVNQAWVELFTEALNDRPNVPDEVELSFLCALHFAPKWFRWENRGRPRMTSEPLGEPKLDKYAEPTIFSSSALIGGLKLALKRDIQQQRAAEAHEKAQKEMEAGAEAEAAPAPADKPESSDPRCGYPHCGADTSPVLFTVPTAEEEPERRRLWMRSLRAVVGALGPDGSEFDPESCTMLCSNHFNEEHVNRVESDGQSIVTLDARAVPVRFRRPAPDAAGGSAKRARLFQPSVVSWADELGRMVETAALQLTDNEEQESSEEERDPQDADDGETRHLLPGGDGVPELELHIKMEPVQVPVTPYRRGRGRGRGWGRGRGRGRPRLYSLPPAPALGRPVSEPSPAFATPTPPSTGPPPPRRPVGRPPSQNTAAQRQLSQLMKAAAAGHFNSFRALDDILSAPSEDRPPRSSADQLLRMCLMLRLKEGDYIREKERAAGDAEHAQNIIAEGDAMEVGDATA